MTERLIEAELKRIAEAHGGELQPKIVVEEARNEASPLHSRFDWNDTTAAHQWRLQQARTLIRAVVSYEALSDGTKVPVRVFVSLTPDREVDDGGYRLALSVMGDEVQRNQMIADALLEMKRFQEKYRNLKELASVFAAMKAVETEELAHTG